VLDWPCPKRARVRGEKAGLKTAGKRKDAFERPGKNQNPKPSQSQLDVKATSSEKAWKETLLSIKRNSSHGLPVGKKEHHPLENYIS